MMKNRKIICTIVGFIAVLCLFVLTPDRRDITAKDFKLSKTDILVNSLFDIQLPSEKYINNFIIYFSMGNANRVGVIDIWFNSNLNFQQMITLLFKELKSENNFKVIGKSSHIYTDGIVKYTITYVEKDDLYNVHITIL